MEQVLPSRRPTFLQRSASVVSLVAWKEKFETYSGKLRKKPSFVSYAQDAYISSDSDMGLLKRGLSDFEDNSVPTPVRENDLPPTYTEVTMGQDETRPPRQLEKKSSCCQDFSALETYLKKKLSIRKKSGCRLQDTQLESAKVFQWLNELLEGDNLEEFLEAYGIPTKGVNIDELKAKLRMFLKERLAESDAAPEVNVDEGVNTEVSSEERRNDPTAPRWQRQISSLEELAHEDNLEKWLESLDVPYFRPIPETKNETRKYLKLQTQHEAETTPPQPDAKVTIPEITPVDSKVPDWQQLVEKMRGLKDEEQLEKWLESLEVPCNMPKDKVKAEIKKFFMHENFETFAGKSIVLQEHSLAKELWEKFEDSSTLKQVAMISGTTVALGLIAVLSTTMLSFAFPAALSANPYFTEVFAQYFIQRQEVAFNLLNFHAQNAKPLSTAWAKQYILWKYC